MPYSSTAWMRWRTRWARFPPQRVPHQVEYLHGASRSVSRRRRSPAWFRRSACGLGRRNTPSWFPGVQRDGKVHGSARRREGVMPIDTMAELREVYRPPAARASLKGSGPSGRALPEVHRSVAVLRHQFRPRRRAVGRLAAGRPARVAGARSRRHDAVAAGPAGKPSGGHVDERGGTSYVGLVFFVPA